MIISCQQCASRFRIDDTKVPPGSFTVNCPKCQATVTATGSPATDKSALSGGQSPSTSSHRRSAPAPLFKMSSADSSTETTSGVGASDMGQLASTLLNLVKGENTSRATKARPAWDRRRVLVCTSQKYREPIARGLSGHNHEVFVAEDTQQAVERMRESRVDIVILDQEFDPVEQGAAFVLREVNVLRPAERRRLFFVCLSSTKRTMDSHAAFLQSVNLVVNLTELDELPDLLNRTVRDYNDLYEDFNAALNVASI